MLIRQLGIADAAPYHTLRLRMLQRHPDAFTSSYEEDVGKPLSWAEQRLAPGAAAPFDFVLGGFSDTRLASLVQMLKTRRNGRQ